MALAITDCILWVIGVNSVLDTTSPGLTMGLAITDCILWVIGVNSVLALRSTCSKTSGLGSSYSLSSQSFSISEESITSKLLASRLYFLVSYIPSLSSLKLLSISEERRIFSL